MGRSAPLHPIPCTLNPLSEQERNLHRNRPRGAFFLAGQTEPTLVVLHVGFAGLGIFDQHIEGADFDAGVAFFKAFRFIDDDGYVNPLGS